MVPLPARPRSKARPARTRQAGRSGLDQGRGQGARQKAAGRAAIVAVDSGRSIHLLLYGLRARAGGCMLPGLAHGRALRGRCSRKCLSGLKFFMGFRLAGVLTSRFYPEIMVIILVVYVRKGLGEPFICVHFHKTVPSFFIILCLEWTKETASLFRTICCARQRTRLGCRTICAWA